MSREGSQTQEGGKGEGQGEGRREANTAEEEADEQAVPGEGVPRDEIAAGVGRVARRMNGLHLQLSDLDHHAVLKDEVLSNVAESMGGDLRAGLVGESFVVKHVIRMMVR